MPTDGLCRCGCGGKTKIASRNRSELGWIKGSPVPSLQGHGQTRPRTPSRIIIVDGKSCRTIPLTKGRETIVDLEDYKSLSQWRWFCHRGYACRRHRAKNTDGTVQMHRVILGLGFGDETQGDHINLNKLDNRRCNLRRCTAQQNSFNRGPNCRNKSGVTGVYWDDKREKWVAQIKSFHHTIEAAIEVREKMVLMVHGEFARIR